MECYDFWKSAGWEKRSCDPPSLAKNGLSFCFLNRTTSLIFIFLLLIEILTSINTRCVDPIQEKTILFLPTLSQIQNNKRNTTTPICFFNEKHSITLHFLPTFYTKHAQLDPLSLNFSSTIN